MQKLWRGFSSLYILDIAFIRLCGYRVSLFGKLFVPLNYSAHWNYLLFWLVQLFVFPLLLVVYFELYIFFLLCWGRYSCSYSQGLGGRESRIDCLATSTSLGSKRPQSWNLLELLCSSSSMPHPSAPEDSGPSEIRLDNVNE